MFQIIYMYVELFTKVNKFSYRWRDECAVEQHMNRIQCYINELAEKKIIEVKRLAITSLLPIAHFNTYVRSTYSAFWHPLPDLPIMLFDVATPLIRLLNF